ncbi:MAG: 16S rRNA (guanine(527)-N(7))-methyltransferase RsmG, partial [Clostridia bacterium]|nr:16S rRNA (guanine(527)-N(7))-methyltransferase RsmG [Clostridia bacterium]
MDYPIALLGEIVPEIALNEQMYARFDTYAHLLEEWNQKINLTAIKEPREVVIKHFADSIIWLKYVDIPKGASVIDIGTGAGFPGIPLKIVRPDIKLTLLDSLNKRLVFLGEVCNSLEITANIVHSRAEEGGRDKKMREKFDFATARAVAHLRELSEYCLPYVKPGGSFIALKG